VEPVPEQDLIHLLQLAQREGGRKEPEGDRRRVDGEPDGGDRRVEDGAVPVMQRRDLREPGTARLTGRGIRLAGARRNGRHDSHRELDSAGMLSVVREGPRLGQPGERGRVLMVERTRRNAASAIIQRSVRGPGGAPRKCPARLVPGALPRRPLQKHRKPPLAGG
jgi:hypothetical protein